MLIIGASGFSLESLEVYISNGNLKENVVFFDNTSAEIKPVIASNFKVLRSLNEISELHKNFDFILGIGGPSAREKLYNLFTSLGGDPYSLIAKNAHIGVINNTINDGVNIMTGTVITSNCVIGKGVLINLNVTIGHDTIIGDFCEICPGVNISGNCEIGRAAFIGTGAILLPHIKIGEGAIIAAGAVVIKDVPPFTMYAGNPAIFKRDLK
jgi:sugar O-acyltransferase (sialic acid O-acetyltransferase NeuD family)